MLRFCDACRVAAHSSTFLNPAQASCVDMPEGTMAASRVLCKVDTLDCAMAEGSVAYGVVGSVDGIERCSAGDGWAPV